VSEHTVDLGFARVDIDRRERTGDPEVIYAAGKTPQDTVAIAAALQEAHPDHPTLITRATAAHIDALRARWSEAVVEHGTVVIGALRESCGRVVIVSAGTSDASVVAEAKLTVAVFGAEPLVVNDVGVAGLHRVLSIRPTLEEADAIIVVAGMEGALPSVVGGLVGTPVIAVPTSVGYGANFGGLSALLGMLNSCAPGVVVCNIDNGFGAGVFAARVARAAARSRPEGAAR